MSSDVEGGEAERIRARLLSLEAERLVLLTRLGELENSPRAVGTCQPETPAAHAATVTTASPASEKIALFRRLFAGRTDVFPLRWENRRTGRGGYAPACSNEWARNLCGKPQVKCGDCPNQAFLPVSDEVVADSDEVAHLFRNERARHSEMMSPTVPT